MSKCNIVERVGAAIAKEQMRQESVGTWNSDDLARAAMEAMREPTDSMIEAALTAPLTPSVGAHAANARKYFRERWYAMVDAAMLKQPKAKK